VLNVAMRANPVGILLTALLLVVGAIVLAYKRSETFRRVVQLVFRAVAAYVGLFVKALAVVWGWLKDKVPAAAAVLRDRVVAVWTAVRDAAGRAWDWVKDKVSSTIERIRSIVGNITGAVSNAGDAVRDKLGSAFEWVRDKIQPIIDAVQWVIDKLASIDFPDLPGFGRGRVVVAGAGATPVGSTGDTYVFNVSGYFGDPDQLAGQLGTILEQHASRKGR
jgi:hypothetical protein